MIILRKKIFGLTNDGGGTSSMDFYKQQKQVWASSGGEAKLGKFTDWMKGQSASGNGIANQTSNLSVDKSSYKGSTLRSLPSSSTGVVGQSGGGGFTLTNPNKVRSTGMAAGIAANQQAASNPNNKSHLMNSAYNSGKTLGFQEGQQSVGLKQGAMNTWNNMSKGQKIGAGVAAGALALGTTAMIANSIKNKRKAKEAEERARSAGRY